MIIGENDETANTQRCLSYCRNKTSLIGKHSWDITESTEKFHTFNLIFVSIKFCDLRKTTCFFLNLQDYGNIIMRIGSWNYASLIMVCHLQYLKSKLVHFKNNFKDLSLKLVFDWILTNRFEPKITNLIELEPNFAFLKARTTCIFFYQKKSEKSKLCC